MAERAYITPKVLKWARESARMDKYTAASKASVSSEKLIDWEEGGSRPTIRQAQSLAKAYKRPFALFFLPDIPKDFQPLQDFRKKGSKPLGTASVFIIREIQQKQAWISEMNEDNNEEEIPFIGKYTIHDKPKDVANDILNTLEIDPLDYNMDNPIREWIDKAESKGIFISRTSFIHSKLKLDSDELQGFAIADKFAPFVFINSDDWNAPQLFTLVHELAHIWTAQTGISNSIEPKAKYDNINPVEMFSNEVAANALMPDRFMYDISNDVFNSARSVFKVSKELGISSFAFLVRALNLKLISFSVYNKLHKEAYIEYQDFLIREAEKKRKLKSKEKKGGPNYYLLQLNKNSRLFTQTVIDAFRGGKIEPTLASNLLNVKSNKFSKLEAQLYK